MQSDFHHIFENGDGASPALLLLHGTGGDEHDLLDLARAVSPRSPLLSVRGKVLENGMPRFFRRSAEGVFDLEDLKFRTGELAAFLEDAKAAYRIARPLYALGFSNGANIAASLLLSDADTLDGAMLLRPMVPFVPQSLPDLKGKKILMLSGLMDPIVPRENAERLAGIFRAADADVMHKIKPVSHALAQSDIADMKDWLSQVD